MNTKANLQFLLNRRGREVTLNQQGATTYNPATGTTSGSSTPLTVKAYFAQYSLSEGASGSVTKGGRSVLLSGVDTSGASYTKPDANDTITGAGHEVTVSGVQEIYNGETLICYICEVDE